MMSQFVSRSRGMLGFATVAVFLSLFGWSSAHAQELDGFKIKNRTQSFVVDGLEELEPGQFRLSLKNDSGKYITAFRLTVNSSNAKGRIEADIVCCNRGIAPGAIHPVYFGAPQERDASRPVKIAIEAVVFDDRTSDGDDEVAAEIDARRLAEGVQLGKIVDLLQKALNDPYVDAPSALDALRTKVDALPSAATPDVLADVRSLSRSRALETDDLTLGVRDGLASGKERLRQSLFQAVHEQETSGILQTNREILSKIKQEYERIIERL